jgi:hypothetical protein
MVPLHGNVRQASTGSSNASDSVGAYSTRPTSRRAPRAHSSGEDGDDRGKVSHPSRNVSRAFFDYLPSLIMGEFPPGV